ncbi:MAG: hypothetical protein ACFE9C_01285 [Candidatus Hodarchaeota archaeon]
MVLYRQILKNLLFTDDVVNDIIAGLENFCIAFNNFFLILCKYLKFIFVFIILSIGILTLLRLRGVYRQSRLVSKDKQDDQFMKPRLILGCSYIVLAFGILFNYITYFLIWILDPLPDRLIYNFIAFSGIDPYYLNGIMDISASEFPHEITIYYCFSFVSLMGLLQILLSLWYLINNNRLINNPSKAFCILISGIMQCILFGFNSSLPLFL